MSNKLLFVGGPWDGQKKEVAQNMFTIDAPSSDGSTIVKYVRREYVLDGMTLNFFHPQGLTNTEVIKHVNANLRTIHQMIGVR